MSILLGFGVIDHLKTETSPEQNCKEIISQGELIISCSVINFESLIETTSFCLAGLYFLRVADFQGVSQNSDLGWIVNTRNCKIPNLSIWDAEVLPYVVRKPLFSGNCTGYNWSSLQGHVSNFGSVSISNYY
jgi:hypothetical protein